MDVLGVTIDVLELGPDAVELFKFHMFAPMEDGANFMVATQRVGHVEPVTE